MEPHSGGEITKSIYLGAQVELGGNLAISYHETHATGRFQLVLKAAESLEMVDLASNSCFMNEFCQS